MGKSVPSSTRLIKEFGRVTAEKLNSSKTPKPKSGNRFFKPETSKSGGDLEKLKLKMEIPQRENRMPLKEVVSDCAKRWFQDTLKEAKAGDSGMQVLVGQMYYSGYGITKDAQKGKAWISKASRSRSMVGKVSDKHPGYNASDSDSDELNDDVK
ncbi:Sel1-like [Macleaya cordata]|uniref:Sel1-like n=1 Tax=Macleaya cordata TaxID=56857 RepID=A0A200R3D2_MACCD|nr:Sel1-like [Macleaya cordata]